MASTLPGRASTFLTHGDLERELAELRSAVRAHMYDTSERRDAALYERVLGPIPGDHRVDDPNDWPDL